MVLNRLLLSKRGEGDQTLRAQEEGVTGDHEGQKSRGSSGSKMAKQKDLFYPSYVLKQPNVDKAKADFDAGFGIDGISSAGTTAKVSYKLGQMYRNKLSPRGYEGDYRENSLTQGKR